MHINVLYHCILPFRNESYSFNMYHFVNLIRQVSGSLYFKTLIKLHDLKEGDAFDISLPFHIRKSHMLFFINVMQNAAPFYID